MRKSGSTCPSCGASNVVDFVQHHRRHPECKKRVLDAVTTGVIPLPQSPAVDDYAPDAKFADVAASEFYNHILHLVMSGMNTLFKKYARPDVMDKCLAIAKGIIECLEQRISVVHGDKAAVTAAFAATQHALTKVNCEEKRAAYNRKVLKVPYIEPVLFKSISAKESQRDAVRFPVVKTMARLLQTNAKLCVSADE
jgi:hypothetical protein